MPLKVLDLFSGIGGFSLGLKRTGGFETIAFCESDPYCQKVLNKHWPEAVCIEDISDFYRLPVPGFIGGWAPHGTAWHALKLDLSSAWILVENVQHTWRRWVPELRRELHARGFASLPIQLSAAEVGAPHLRRRCFIVAHPDGERVREFTRWWRGESGKVAKELSRTWDYRPGAARANDGISRRLDRNRAIGNAVMPQVVEVIGRGVLAVEDGE